MKKKIMVGLLAILFVLGGCSAPRKEQTPIGTVEKQDLKKAEKPLDTAGKDVAQMTEAAEYRDELKSKYDTNEILNSAESYLDISDHKNIATDENSVLTFSLKVDTSAYNNVQRYLESGNLPPKDAVKTEELINYFNYDGKMEFQENSPFAIYTELGTSPFDASKRLAFIRVKSKEMDRSDLPNSNLTFLIDTSGSMDSYDKLPLLKEAFKLLTESLTEDDKVSIVTYAGSSEIVLDSVSGADQEKILKAIENLTSGGSTAGAQGITTAYKLAKKNYLKGGNNRIILATDGDFNVGLTTHEELEDLVIKQKDNGIYFSILGFGTGNLKDDKIETLAKNGNGNYSYINSVSAANKVLVEEMGSNLFVIADDVKAQVEFNPANVKSYRLIGYENRMLDNQDFEDDTKDAGEIGIGTDVVVVFELEMQGEGNSQGLKYGNDPLPLTESGEFSEELFEVRIRYKDPGKTESKLLEIPVTRQDIRAKNSNDFNFAASVAGFAHLLRNSEFSGDVTIKNVMQLAESSFGEDQTGYRHEFFELLKIYDRMVD